MSYPTRPVRIIGKGGSRPRLPSRKLQNERPQVLRDERYKIHCPGCYSDKDLVPQKQTWLASFSRDWQGREGRGLVCTQHHDHCIGELVMTVGSSTAAVGSNSTARLVSRTDRRVHSFGRLTKNDRHHNTPIELATKSTQAREIRTTRRSMRSPESH